MPRQAGETAQQRSQRLLEASRTSMLKFKQAECIRLLKSDLDLVRDTYEEWERLGRFKQQQPKKMLAITDGAPASKEVAVPTRNGVHQELWGIRSLSTWISLGFVSDLRRSIRHPRSKMSDGPLQIS